MSWAAQLGTHQHDLPHAAHYFYYVFSYQSLFESWPWLTKSSLGMISAHACTAKSAYWIPCLYLEAIINSYWLSLCWVRFYHIISFHGHFVSQRTLAFLKILSLLEPLAYVRIFEPKLNEALISFLSYGDLNFGLLLCEQHWYSMKHSENSEYTSVTKFNAWPPDPCYKQSLSIFNH